jgi:peptide methionine sulfoxide reductase msrA/msrB
MRLLVFIAVLSVASCAPEERAGRSPASSTSKPMMKEVPANLEIIVLAGGCFWGMEEILRKIPGVVDTEVGYAAGAESVRVVFDPAKLSLSELLDRWYFRMHDPTTKDRQGNDEGSQYRSAIFYTTETQRGIAQASKAAATASGRWEDPIVTEIVALGSFSPGEDFHQDYLEKNPGGYTCHYVRD